MTTLDDHSRSLIRYTVWADKRLLAAADGIDEIQFSQISAALGHMLGTQRYWYANWIGGQFEQPALETFAETRDAYAASHEALAAFGAKLTLDEWHRSEEWWKQWGYDATMPVGEAITQVFYHGIQHRAELAQLLTTWGHSPGDLDYLEYLRESGTTPGLPAR